MFNHFEAIKIGDSAKLTRKITEEDIRKFVEMTGDDNPLHVNREYAKLTPFKDIVVHGMLGASFISTIIGTQLPGVGALWVSQTLDFLLPVRLGDELTVSAKVLQKFDRERMIELETLVLNQSGQTVLSGKGKVRLLESQTPEKKSEAEHCKVAIVTGGAGGIGQAICIALAKAGYDVAVNYHQSKNEAETLVKTIESAGGRAIAVKANISNPIEAEQLVQKTIKAFGSISVLVNNASPKIVSKTIDKLSWDEIESQFNVQIKGAFHLSKLCVPHMKEQKHGKIINITSQVLDGVPTQGWTAYALAKSALAALTRQLAAELGPFGINVNNISPSMTDTGFIGDIPEKQRLIIARQAPLRRLAKAEDVANSVAFLASDAADFITGETIRVNGGQIML